MSFENGAPSAPTAPVSAPASSPAVPSSSGERPSVSKNPFVRRETPPASGSIPQTPSTPNRGEAPASGSAGPEGAPLDSGVPAQQQVQPQVQPQAQPQQMPNQQPVVQMTPEMLAQMMRSAQPQQQQPQEPQFNEQEFRQKYNIFDFSAQHYQEIFGVAPDSPERVQAFNSILQGIAKQSVTLAQALAQSEIEKRFAAMNEQFAPIQQRYKEQVEEQYKQDFFKSYPHLQGREPMLKEIISAAIARGIKFNSPQEAMKYVADTAHKFVAPPQGGVSPQAAPTQSVRPMPTTSLGGRAGGSAPSKPVNTAQAIFGRANRT